MAQATAAEPSRRYVRLAARALSWLAVIAALLWAVRLVVLEGYIYEIPNNFLGDFTRTASLGAPTWFDGNNLFYGPIFVFEYKFLFDPHILTAAGFARLDFVLFGIAFVCCWLAFVGPRRPRLALLVLAAWLGHHMSVEAFANTAHLEVLELALLSVALLLAVRGYQPMAGGALGLAIATKTLPGVFLPYLAITRQWRFLIGAVLTAGVPFLAVCWMLRITPWDGALQLIYQGGNLTKLDYTEYEYGPRAEIARFLAGDGGSLSAAQAQLAVTLHLMLALAVTLFAAGVLARARLVGTGYGLMFGLISVVMLVASPSVHAPYYIFLLPGWTAALAELLHRPLSRRTGALWAALLMAYVLTGFDQPFFLMQRVLGFGMVVPQHWYAWHLPDIGLLLTLATDTLLLLSPAPLPAADNAPLVAPRLAGNRRRWRWA